MTRDPGGILFPSVTKLLAPIKQLSPIMASFKMADFIKGLDSLVKTKNQNVAVTGRLLTINGFTLEPDKSTGFPQLEGEFSVTTFLTPPEQGVTAGATPTSPAPEATPASTSTGGTP